ncbi:MAG: YbaN family protein [Paludibacteraceae bacterium]|nr:YbaN family protein [Paludibacteraceae bacterium]
MKPAPTAPETLKPFYLILGVLSVVLGTVGIFVPGLPTTPLVLLASWCFYRSSPRLQAWLLQSFLGKYIREYRDKGGLTMRKRISIILLMATMVAISTIFFISSMPIRIIVWTAGLIGCIVVGFVVPKAKN